MKAEVMLSECPSPSQQKPQHPDPWVFCFNPSHEFYNGEETGSNSKSEDAPGMSAAMMNKVHTSTALWLPLASVNTSWLSIHTVWRKEALHYFTLTIIHFSTKHKGSFSHFLFKVNTQLQPLHIAEIQMLGVDWVVPPLEISSSLFIWETFLHSGW